MLIFPILLGGCSASPPNPRAFMNWDFSAELCGTSDCGEFTAVISVENCGSGRSCLLRYLSPEPLAGLELSFFYGSNETYADTVAVKAPDGRLYSLPTCAVEGLGRPLYSLVDAYGEIGSVKRSSNAYLFTCADGAQRSFSANAVPLSLVREDISWSITNFTVHKS